MESRKNRSLRARMRCAWLGLRHGLLTQASLRLQAIALAAVLVVLLWLRPSAIWWALALLASSAVLAAELLNTAIEQLADALHPAQSAHIRIVKDCAAAAVLLTVLGALAVTAAFIVHLLHTHGGGLQHP
jgi:diacylglycerol kinase